jgi:hypothetical protein
MIYQIKGDRLILVRLGNHAELSKGHTADPRIRGRFFQWLHDTRSVSIRAFSGRITAESLKNAPGEEVGTGGHIPRAMLNWNFIATIGEKHDATFSFVKGSNRKYAPNCSLC